MPGGKSRSKQRSNVENKIFVGGLSQNTTHESMSRHFQQYGSADAVVMMDKATGRSRGFGFCTFASAEAAELALESSQSIDGKTVECCACWAKAARLESNKIFVGALAQSTTTETLHEHFSQYGECDVIVMMDKMTSRSRGFGFVTFAEHESLLAALSTPQTVDGKTVDCKVCSPKGEVQSPYMPNRIFVGGLPQSADETKLREFFSQYGAIAETRIMTDKESSRSRGFGYVTFQSAQSCELALANRVANCIDEKWVEVKRCTEKAATKGNYPQALSQLSPQQLTQVAHLTSQLQNLLGQPLMQALQSQIVAGPAAGSNGKTSKGRGDPPLVDSSNCSATRPHATRCERGRGRPPR